MADALYIYAYDIANDRRRVRAARLLGDHGARVQHSVFEVIQSADESARLVHKVERELEPGDRLRVYAMPLASVSTIHCYGGAPVQQGRDWWLL